MYGLYFWKEWINFWYSVNIERVIFGCEYWIGWNSGVMFWEGDGSMFFLMMVFGRIMLLFVDVFIGNLRLFNVLIEVDVVMFIV